MSQRVQRGLCALWIGLALGTAPIGLVALAPAALAVQPEEILDDPALEARARELSKGLRCVVCKNQTIDESDAPLAGDMRRMVRQRLLAGDSDAQILARLEDAYGEYVHMRPRFTWSNALLWLSGPAILALGAALFARRVRPAPDAATPSASGASAPELTDEERKRLARLLED